MPDAPEAWPRFAPSANGLGKIKAMLDVIVLAMGLGFFALAVAYTAACDRL